ncbi:MAG: hypothetical protein Q4G35_09360 [Propionibacteriaceae bacterium]|nr:hypothetical protein [Propionibacteriaceae bacterium]
MTSEVPDSIRLSHPSRRRIWLGGRTDMRLRDAVGQVLVAADDGTDPETAKLYALEVTGSEFQVSVRFGPLGSKDQPEKAAAPGWQRLDDFVQEHCEFTVSRVLITPGIRWARTVTARDIAIRIALVIGLGLVGWISFSMNQLLVAAFCVFAGLVGFALTSGISSPTAIHRPGNKEPYSRKHVLERIAELPALEPSSLALTHVAPPGTLAAAQRRVDVVKEQYGALLLDVAYRIERSALFDPAVHTTREFTVLLAQWDSGNLPPEAAIRLAHEIELAFAAARQHAESVGLSHLPHTARQDAARAAKSARLAQRAATEGERAAALERTFRILESLALYYLPSPEEAAQALGAAPDRWCLPRGR